MLKWLLYLWVGCLFSSGALGQGLDQIKSGGMKITAISSSHIMVSGNRSLVNGQNILIVRLNPDDDDYETIATGKVVKSKGNTAAIKIDMQTLKKQPLKTDVAIYLGAPKVFISKKTAGQEQNLFPTLTDVEPLPPGYVWFQYQMDDSSLTSSSTNQANSFKNSKMKSTGYSFEWFFDFVPHYGIGISSQSTVVPIKSYYREVVDAQVRQSTFKLMYRTKKYSNFRGLLSLYSTAEEFMTNNPDEYVITSSSKLNSLGLALDWEPGDLILKDQKMKTELTFLRLQYLTTLAGNIQDGQFVSRGTSGQLKMNELRVTASATTYLPWVPFIKRYTLNLEYYTKSTTSAFSGATRGEGAVSTIPENGSYGEKEVGMYIGIGMRFDDVVGRIFKPKN